MSSRVFGRWLSSITMYRLMLYFLIALLGIAVVLSVVGQSPYNPWSIALQTMAFVAICWAVNTLLARLMHVTANIESPLITGLILAAIAGPLSLPREWFVVVVMAVAAMASKYLVAPRHSHIFNPAAFGVVVSALVLGYPASWWIGNQALLPVVLIGGLLLMGKIRRWHLVLSWLGVYIGLLALDAFIVQGRSVSETAGMLQNLLLATPLFFFSFVMLTEPLTAPQTQSRRIAFGAFVGATLFVLQRFFTGIPFSLELALLIGNVFGRIISPDFRQAFTLRHKDFFSSSIGSFWFEPRHRFSFTPGQFLEYTFAHPRPDARGIRRYFSIASAPTEPRVLLTSRFSDRGSTFKRALHQMREGDTITAAKVAGDFVLPPPRAGQKLAFIAGGIGITPFRSMIKYLLDTREARNIVLLYAMHQEQDVVFRDIFDQAHAAFGLRTIYWTDQSGLIDETMLREKVPDFQERLWYISGPEPMVAAMSTTLRRMGIPRRHIKRDYFPGYAA